MNEDLPNPALPHAVKRRHLAAHIIDTLRDEIVSGRVAPGEKLPSEAKLSERFDVSRTVVREAIAGLRADGLVIPRQGSGVFVLAPPKSAIKPFHITDPGRISAVLEMLELRIPVEAEAAALAAQRRSPAQEEAIYQAANEILRCAAEGRPSKEADLAFHLAIADATNNPRFREFLEILGVAIIPRAALEIADGQSSESYLQLIASEHHHIAEAIGQGDCDAARAAMHRHLRESMLRYRSIQRAHQGLSDKS